MSKLSYYNSLNKAQQRKVWEQLEETPGWQMLVEHYSEEFAQDVSNLPEVKTLDTKEAFVFQAAKMMGKHDVIGFVRRKKAIIGD
jgi:hypothetical protein